MGSSASPADRQEPPDLLAWALDAYEASLSVLPPRQDGSKQPDVSSWARYQQQRATRDELGRWYGKGRRTGLGYVCGAVSGHLELFEFDDRTVYDTFLGAAEAADLDDLIGRIRTGYEEITPGGGIHWFYRLIDTDAKTVALARRPGADAAGKARPLPLIETKGEGGYAIAAPSFGRVHPNGGAYHLVLGGVLTITTITAREREALWALARSFDELPKAQFSTTPRGGMENDARWIVRPGDAFNERVSWAELLEPHGWEAVRQRGDETLWRRPDGYPGGWGAATNHQGSDRLYVWTTATALEPDRSYTKFATHAILNHGGDFAAASGALEAQGFGERRGMAEIGASAPVKALVSVPPFPLDALPPIARNFVAAGAEALGCPPDFIAPHLLAFVGAAAGNRHKLQLKAGYVVAAIFWVGVIGRPGTVKTPALNHARRTLDALQQAAWEIYQQDLARWEEEKPAERGPKPRPEHVFATDTTTEAVAWALTTSRGLAVIHDELAGWVGSFDAYRQAGDRQTWLSAWSGAPLKPNRKTGDPIYVPDPVVCVAGGIQPDVLPTLAGEAMRDDGFIPRLLLSWPDAEPAPWTDASIDERVVTALVATVKELRLPTGETVITTLTTEAYGEWKRWYDQNRVLIATSTGLSAGWAAKAPVHLARIALVLHLLAHPSQGHQLGGDTLRDAIAVLEYFRAHLGRVLPAFGATVSSGSAGLSARVLRILTRDFPEWVGRAELRAHLGGHDPADAVGAVLAALRADGQVESRTLATGGRPREEWRSVPVPISAHIEPNAEDALPVRDKWKDVESPISEDLPRNHVITQERDSDPMEQWDHWEEPL